MDEEGQITPGLYPVALLGNPPELTNSPYGGGRGHQYIRLAGASDDFAEVPIPQQVYDIYRVKKWKLEAEYVDPLPDEDPDFDYSFSFSQIFNAGTYYDDYFGDEWPFDPGLIPPGYEGPIFGTGWTTIEEAINRKGTFDTGGIFVMQNGLAGCRFFKTISNGTGASRDLNAGVVIRPPRLMYDSTGALIWALPVYGMSGLSTVPFSSADASISTTYGDQGALFGFASAWEYYEDGRGGEGERGMTRFIDALGDTAGPDDDVSPPVYGGWTVSLSIEEYFD